MMAHEVGLEKGVPCPDAFLFAAAFLGKGAASEAEIGKRRKGFQPEQLLFRRTLEKPGVRRVQKARFAQKGGEDGPGRIGQRGGFGGWQGPDAPQEMAVEEFVKGSGFKAGQRRFKGQILRRLAGEIAGHGFGGGVGVAVGEGRCGHG